MKKIAIFFASLAILSACGGSKETPEQGGSSGGGGGSTTTPTITIGSGVNTNPVITAAGGSATVSFTATDSWTASVINTRADNWISVSPTSGNKGNATITISALANDTPDERGATIQIKCGTATKSITLTQKQKDSFTASASKTELGSDGGTFTIEVKANVEFTYSIDSGAEWIKYVSTKALKTSTLTFSAEANDDVTRREGQITVSSSVGSEVFKIYEEGTTPSIVITQSSYSVGSEGETIKVEVKSNVDVTIQIPEASAAWIKEATGSKAMSTNTYNFVIAENEGTDSRTGSILFTNTANGLTETVTVLQAQKDAIVIAQALYEMPVSGGKITVRISHNVDFTTEISAAWITKASTKAMTTEDIVFDVAENDSGAERTGTITFKAGELQQVVTVKQATATQEQSETKPGVFGVEGLNWEYRDRQDQILIRESDEEFAFALIEPETNKIFALYAVVNEEPRVGAAINAMLLQNISSDVAGLIESEVLIITQVEGDYVWMRPSSMSSEYIIIKYR